MHQNSDLLYSGNNNINRSVEQNFKKSPNMIEQNFNFSPSNIFNQNNNNNIYLNSSSNNSLNNYKIQKENSIEEEENKTLQERIGILLGKNESNKNNNILINHNTNTNTNTNNVINNNINNQINNLNLVNNNYININNNNTNNLNNNQNINNNNINNIPQNEEENENQEEVYILNLNSEDENEKDYEDEIQKNNSENNNKNNKKEYQNKINIKEQLNNIINTNENEFPSYGGGTVYNNTSNTNNTNINTNQNQQNIPILNNINNTMNNIYYTPMNNNIIYPPINYGYFPYGYFNNQNINNTYYPQKIGQFMNMPFVPVNQSNNNKFTNLKNEKNTKPFYYNGDQYQINNHNRNKNNNNSNSNKKQENKFNNININQNDKNIYTIGSKDLVVTITSNKKKIKRVNPKAYLNESYEYLSHNIFILSKDQAGCRFLQEKIEEDPINATNYFYEAIQPHLTSLMKDPFGNYLVQKIIKNLDEKKIKKILEIISSSIVEIGTNSHGTRVVQFLIGFLTTEELQNYFIEIIKPYTIHLLKELNGAHIIQKVLLNYPNSCEEINKLIIENCSFLATHRHGCCVLQKFIDGNYKNLEENLIQNLVNNTLMLITDQFGNYVIQSILLLKRDEINSQIAKKINDNIPYYSKHRYSSNVVEKCFDLCNENDKNNFVEKLCSNEIVTELILDDHGNYVIQKVLQCANDKIKEKILKIIFTLIPKIKEVSFGERLLNRLLSSYPQLNGNNFNNNNNAKKKNNFENKNEQEKNYKNWKNKK